jgi:hypothetical protein
MELIQIEQIKPLESGKVSVEDPRLQALAEALLSQIPAYLLTFAKQIIFRIGEFESAREFYTDPNGDIVISFSEDYWDEFVSRYKLFNLVEMEQGQSLVQIQRPKRIAYWAEILEHELRHAQMTALHSDRADIPKLTEADWGSLKSILTDQVVEGLASNLKMQESNYDNLSWNNKVELNHQLIYLCAKLIKNSELRRKYLYYAFDSGWQEYYLAILSQLSALQTDPFIADKMQPDYYVRNAYYLLPYNSFALPNLEFNPHKEEVLAQAMQILQEREPQGFESVINDLEYERLNYWPDNVDLGPLRNW